MWATINHAVGFRPLVDDLTGTVEPYSLHHAANASIVGPSPRAFCVISYSTRGGTSANMVRDINPSASSSLSWAVSMCCVMPGMAFRSSPKR